MQYRYSGDKKS